MESIVARPLKNSQVNYKFSILKKMKEFTKEFSNALKKHAKLQYHQDLSDFEVNELAERIDKMFNYMIESACFDRLLDCLHSTEADLCEMTELVNRKNKTIT